MPPDPFSGQQEDWSQMAAGMHGFYAALMAAGFAEGPALHLTTQYLNTLLAVMMANAVQQDPGGA
jgi:urea transporter